MVSLIEKVSHLLAIMFSLRNTIFADMARQVTTNLYAALLEELRGSHLHIAATNVYVRTFRFAQKLRWLAMYNIFLSLFLIPE